MALKAKILTFAASPLFNNDKPYYDGSTEAEQQHLVWYGDYQQSRWEDALQACEDFFKELKKNGYYTSVRQQPKLLMPIATLTVWAISVTTVRKLSTPHV